MKLEGIYFDGRSSKPLSAEATIYRDYISIHVPETDVTIKWEHGNVRKPETSGDKIILKYGEEFPFPTLQLNKTQFNAVVKQYELSHYYPPGNFFKSASTPTILLGLVGAFIALAVLFYLYIIPLIISGVAEVFPRSAEVSMGKAMKDNFIANTKIDSAKTVAANKFVKLLKTGSDYPIHVTVVHNSVKNAFALPGGEIVVYSDILKDMKSYDELVALLGHEIGHVQEKHTLKTLLRNVSGYIIISIVFSDVAGIVTILVQNASQLEQLHYNRELESQADDYGYKVMLMNKANPKGMEDLFKQLEGDSAATGIIPEFLQTHPKIENRIESVKERMSSEKSTVVKNDSLAYYWAKLVK